MEKNILSILVNIFDLRPLAVAEDARKLKEAEAEILELILSHKPPFKSLMYSDHHFWADGYNNGIMAYEKIIHKLKGE